MWYADNFAVNNKVQVCFMCQRHETKISGKIENIKRVAIFPYGIGFNVVTQEWCEIDL